MKIKICGIKYPDNLKEVLGFKPDYLGLIFYKKSSRFMEETLLPDDLKNICAKKTGVFVNQNFEEVKGIVNKYALDCVQLHGKETPELCRKLKKEGVEVIKVFSVDEDFDFAGTEIYGNCSDYFLFDTKGKQEGGNGFAFNWKLLNKYHLEKPFFLSGGIGPENIEEALRIAHPFLKGIDLNSRVEISPGVKDLQKIQQVITQIKNTKK